MEPKKKSLIGYMVRFMQAFVEQLIADEKRWGLTWKHRPREGQEERVYARFNAYYKEYKFHGKPIPWLKIIGNAYIAWVRENFEDWDIE